MVSDKKVVTRNDFITKRELADLTTKARKLMYYVIANCRMYDTKFLECRINAQEIAELLNIDRHEVYKITDKLTDELQTFKLTHREPGEEKYIKKVFFPTCAYCDGMLTMKINEELKPYFLELKKNFTQVRLEDFTVMKSSFTMALWHLFQREMSGKRPMKNQEIKFYLSLEELRRVTGTEKTFNKISEFKARVLNQATKELKENCICDIMYINVKSGRKIKGFEFVARSPWRT